MVKIDGCKILIFSVLFLAVSLLSSPVKAAENKVAKEDYLEMMEAVKSAVSKGYSDEHIELLPEVLKFQSKYSDDEINEFLINNVFDEESELTRDQELANLGEIELEENQNELIEFNDGTFMVMSSETEVLEPDTDIIQTFSTGEYQSGGLLSTTNKVEFWGAYLAARAELRTSFRPYTNKITIQDVTRGNSMSRFPTTLQVHSTKVITNNAKTVSSRGSYTRVNGIVIGGQPIGATRSFDLKTNISIVKTNGKRVTIRITHTGP
ncbi:hypothetical protein ACTHP3_21660 [Shouchella rhizosphaerae]|uniref:hypothetical protein n=1 Tax=Shouchella rhizosphaerae TaxID=866786 RepID=UPI003F7F6544